MAQVFLGCSKCGDPLPVDEEAVKNSLTLHGTLPSVQHDVCPGTVAEGELGEAPPMRRFRAQILFVELPPLTDPKYAPEDEEGGGRNPNVEPEFKVIVDMESFDLLAGIGVTFEAESFSKAVNGPFTHWLNETWPKMQENAAYADLPAPTPATEA